MTREEKQKAIDAVERLNALKQFIGYDKDSEIVQVTQKSLDMAIKALEQTRWIPVEKELPELEKDVLVSLKSGRMFVAALFPGSEGHEHWWIGEEEIHFAFNEVDGWMPLPEPYRTIARFEPTGKFHKCRCSACKTEFEEEMFYDNPVFKFCPNCAARMEVDR